MSREKQIEDMRKDLIEIFDEEYEKRRIITADFTAIKMSAKGYRKQEWISVDERLPERKGRYLVYIPNEQLICCMYYDCDASVYGDNGVTHWMPLPEAPKMKGGAE